MNEQEHGDRCGRLLRELFVNQSIPSDEAVLSMLSMVMTEFQLRSIEPEAVRRILMKAADRYEALQSDPDMKAAVKAHREAETLRKS